MSKRDKRVKALRKQRNRRRNEPRAKYLAQCQSKGEWRDVSLFPTLTAANTELDFIEAANEPNMPPVRLIDVRKKKVIRTYEGTRVTDKPKTDWDSLKRKSE